MHSELAEDFKLLSVEARLQILRALQDSPSLCVKALAARINSPITPSALSQHLRLLKAARWVTCLKKGYWVHYSLNPKRFKDFKESVGEFLRSPRAKRPRVL